MSKRNKIIYWIATVWLALGMFSTGLVQLLKVKEEAEFILNLGYPAYLLTLLGICKILGVVAILIPKYPVLKEWAYAGFFFVMTGAIFSHFATGDMNKMLPAVLLLVLTVTSWYFRPPNRKPVLVNQ
ncbi:DoxX family protein [Chitinophaga sp.]|uniref:DoxX family protein n=1 Tax=Chitinophaga sp. TaxID=1869181 RepID=UPI0031E2B2A4